MEDVARGVTRTDSAGVVIMSYRAGWTEQLTRWTIEPTPVVTIGTDPVAEGHDLHRVVGGVVISGGVAIGDGTSGEIRFFDMNGTLVRTAGGHGGGPREFGSLTWFGRSASGMAGVDWRSPALVEFDGRGAFIRRTKLRGWSDIGTIGGAALPRVIGLTQGNDVVLRAGVNEMGLRDRRAGRYRDSVTIVIASVRDGDRIADGVRIALPGEETSFVQEEQGWGSERVLFGRDAFAAVGRQRIFIGTNDAFEIQVGSRSGEVERILRAVRPTRVVQPEDVREERRLRMSTLSVSRAAGHETAARMIELRQHIVQSLPARDTYPAYSRLFADRLDQLWVRDYPPPAARLVDWFVFDASGAALATIELPVDAAPLDASETQLLLLTKSLSRGEAVALFRILHPEGG
jgi:hypothetical protein